MLNFCDFIQVFIFATNHHLNPLMPGVPRSSDAASDPILHPVRINITYVEIFGGKYNRLGKQISRNIVSCPIQAVYKPVSRDVVQCWPLRSFLAQASKILENP